MFSAPIVKYRTTPENRNAEFFKDLFCLDVSQTCLSLWSFIFNMKSLLEESGLF